MVDPSTPGTDSGVGTLGREEPGAGAGAGAGALAAGAPALPRTTAGRVSYASRLMFKRCFGEMLSDVMLPPNPPQPSVIAGSRPVVKPIDPCVVGVFTTMRNAGFFRPNSRITGSFLE